MASTTLTRGMTGAVVILGLTACSGSGHTQLTDIPALTGMVTSQAEGAMEGVLVTAQRADSTVRTTVVTDAQGRYAFPRSRMAPGKYAITIRASGYELPVAATAEVPPGEGSAQLNLTLNKVTDPLELASHLTSLDWFHSMPGTTEDKDSFVRRAMNCGFCHTMEKVARSTYTAEEWVPVIQRMSLYDPDRTSGVKGGRAQKQRPGKPGFDAMGNSLNEWRGWPIEKIARHLAALNLSGGKTTWSYPLKTMPRPKGRATRAIVTVYPIPRQPSVIHDLSVDSKGNVWYGNSGWDYLGMLDPKTGTFREWPLPPRSRPSNQGIMEVLPDHEGNVWIGWEGKPIRFNPKTEKVETPYQIPDGIECGLGRPQPGLDFFSTPGSIRRPPPAGSDPLGAARGITTAHCRINVKTGKVEAFPLFVNAPKGPHRPYQFVTDSRGNSYRTDWGTYWETPGESHYVWRVDARTGASTYVQTPTPKAFPRRGAVDAQDRFWFGEFWGDSIGMLDTKTMRIQEFPVGVKYISPYAAIADRNGDVWASSNGSDRLIRLNPKTGETTLYLMPEYYDSRKIDADTSASRVTIWVASKNTSFLARVEPLD